MRCLNKRASVFEILKRPAGKSLESRLQAAERASLGAGENVSEYVTLSEFWPAEAGTTNTGPEYK